MAGAGYKLFNTGDVLTAAQVNTYLQEQVVMVFANAAARTTALSGVLAEGMVSYLKDTDALEIYSGAAWVGYGSGDITGITTGATSGLTGGVTSGTADLKFNTTAKGGLLIGTGSGTVSELALGTNNYVLTADSTQTTGVKWAAGATSPTWSSWTPSWTNLTVGNGTTVAEYATDGDIIFVRLLFTFGTTSSITGNVTCSFPVNASTTIDDPDIGGGLMGNAMLFDTSAAKPINGTPFQISATGWRISPDIETGSYVNGGGVIQAATPFTWASTDNIQATFWYRKA